MRRLACLCLALFFVLVTAVPAGANHEDGPSYFSELRDLQERADRQLHRLQRNLADMEALAEQLPPCSVRDELLRRIDRTKRLGRRMAHTADGLIAIASESLEPVAHFVPEAMPEEEYRRVSAALQREWFDDGRYELLVDIGRDRLFTTAQVIRVMNLFTFDDRKIDAAAFLYARTVDPQDFYRTYDALTFSSSKEELRRRIR